ncbi:serine/threonine protein kinase [Xenococcus sp. PCC 7305]|uniref:serine/threonine-protein kinase n=1 Tax=Xenococcus sp. PCC 7305 TaxID=102125 RepID=UPI0002AC6E1C|nr:serine/threonine-protein kinase [Xenococcus sp. PCC 7305]ELS05373.1 serine/threonine protein kinase [Xenococcus sp. PCC 7305]
MESLLGKILKNQYYISRQLAHKNYWTIYLAEDRTASLGPLCVVQRLRTQIEAKFLKTQAGNNLRESLTLELMKLKQIDHHPQIPEIRDFFIIDRDFYFVRDFIVGETLAEEITRHILTEAEIISLMKDSLPCLGFIHQKNMLHLNIKPSNIIRHQEDGTIFLTGFGSLKRMIEDNNLQPKFLTRQYLKDQEFTAPEQLQNNPVVASDIYALGKVAIYALSGKKDNKIAINNLDNFARSAIKDLKNNQEISISSKLANVLDKMTRDRPQDRYQSVTEVLQDLEQEENVVVFPPPFDEEMVEKRDLSAIGTKSRKHVTQAKQETRKTSNLSFSTFKPWRIFIIPLVISLFLATILLRNITKYRNFVDYNNEIHEISFKYPKDWSLEELDDPITGDILVLTSPAEDGFDLFQEKIYLSIDELPEDVNNLDLYSQTMFKKIQAQLEPNTVIYQGEIDKLDGMNARSLMYLRQEDAKSLQQMEIFTVKGNRAYVFTYVAEDIKYQDFLQVTKKILGSLKIRNTTISEQQEKGQ